MPPLTLENAAALVGGAVTDKMLKDERNDMQVNAQRPQPAAQVRVKVLRSFMFNKKVLEKDAELDLPRPFALEMRAANKVELLVAAAAPAVAASPEVAPTKELRSSKQAALPTS